ncbi:putative AMP nucleosidase, partial [Chlamydia psittaci 84-8471/1]
RRRFIDHL